MEFMDFESGVRASAARPSPYGVIPPYFFIGGKDSGRLDANTGAVRLAIEQKKGGGGDRIVVPVMLDRSVMLDRGEAARIVDAYDIDGVGEFGLDRTHGREKRRPRHARVL